MNPTIEVLVIERVFIVPDPTTGVRDFVAHEPDTIVARIGLDRVAHRRASPSFNGWLLSHGGSYGLETKRLIDSGYAVLTVRSVVIHVAFRGMGRAPDAFVRDDVIRFSKVLRPRVQRRIQVVNVNQHSVRRYVMNVAAVIIWRCLRIATREKTSEWIDPCARTNAGLGTV